MHNFMMNKWYKGSLCSLTCQIWICELWFTLSFHVYFQHIIFVVYKNSFQPAPWLYGPISIWNKKKTIRVLTIWGNCWYMSVWILSLFGWIQILNIKCSFTREFLLLFYILLLLSSSLPAVWQGVLPNITVDWTKQQALIPNLHPSFTYHIRVLANNSVGYSDPSDIVEAQTEEEGIALVPSPCEYHWAWLLTRFTVIAHLYLVLEDCWDRV